MLRKFSKILTFVFLFAFIGQFLVFSVFYLTSDELLEEVCEVEMDETLDDIFSSRDNTTFFFGIIEKDQVTTESNSKLIYTASDQTYKQIEKSIPVPPPEFFTI